jgi:ABC-type multidrug transport system fused ATPase/permease subunit
MRRVIKLIRRAAELYKPFRWSFFTVLILTLLQKGIGDFSSYFIGRAVDAFSSQNLQVAVVFLSIYLTSRILPTFIDRFKMLFSIQRLEFDFSHYVERDSVKKSLNLSLGQLKNDHSAFKQDTLNAGANSIGYLKTILFENILPIVSSISVALVGLFLMNKNMFLISILFFLIYVLFGNWLNGKMIAPMRKLTELRKEKNKQMVDLLRSLFLIKFNGQTQGAENQLENYQKKQRDHGVELWAGYHIKMFISDAMLAIYLLIIAYYAYVGVLNGSITPGSLIPIFTWSAGFSGGLISIRNIQRNTAYTLVDLEKMFDMLDQRSDVHIEENPMPIQSFDDKILFEHVYFSYKEGKKDALKDICLEIKKGEKVALVGRSGSGKTTIVSLLLRLYDPSAGSISVDRVELKALELSDWHDMLAYVPQDGDLLDISIRDNILFGAKRKVTEPEIEAVLDKAGIKEFIHNLPQGIDTLVGERGVKLSGGQKQRVCIARALIKDAPILLLDEATSSLDSETESIVNKAIWEMLGDKTGVVIAHRLSTILDADKIVVMDHGEIVGIGTHEELLKSTPYYKKLVDAQNINL